MSSVKASVAAVKKRPKRDESVKKSKGLKGGSSAMRASKDEIKAAAARKRAEASGASMMCPVKDKRKSASSLRSSTPKKRSKSSKKGKAVASTAVLPPGDDAITEVMVSTRPRKTKCKGKRKIRRVLVELKGSGRAKKKVAKCLKPSNYVKPVQSLKKGVATASATGSHSADDFKEEVSTISAVGGGAVATDDIKEDSVVNAESVDDSPLLRYRADLNCGVGGVDGFDVFLTHAVRKRRVRYVKKLEELLPSFVEEKRWHATVEQIKASPQWKFYEKLVTKKKSELQMNLGQVLKHLQQNYIGMSLKGWAEIKRLIQSGLPLEQIIADVTQKLDSGVLTPEIVVNNMFLSRWSKGEEIVFNQVIAGKMKPLLCAGHQTADGVQVLDALALATKMQHMAAMKCLKDPRDSQKPTARTHEIVRVRALAQKSTEVLRKRKAAAEDTDDRIEKEYFERRAAESKQGIVDMMNALVKFNGDYYERARIVADGIEQIVSDKLSEYLRSGDSRKVAYATSMAKECASTKLYDDLLTVVRQLNKDLPTKFAKGFAKENGGENQSAYATLCDEHNAWLKHKFKSKLLEKKSAERSQSKCLSPCKRLSFLKSVDMRSAASGSQSAEHIYDMGSYATDLHIEALALHPYVHDFFVAKFGERRHLCDALFFEGPPKGVERMREKGRKVDPSEAYPTTAEIADAIRYTATFKDCKQYVEGMEAFVKYVCGKTELTRVGDVCIELVQVKNNFAGRKTTDAIDKYLDVKFIFVVYVLLADGTIHKLVGEMQFMTATMFAFKKPSHDFYELTRTSEQALADLRAADDFDICELHSDALWLPLLDAGYKPPVEDIEKAVFKAIVCEDIGINAVLRTLGWLPTAEEKSAALRKLLESPALFNKFVEFNGSRHDFVEHLKVFDAYAKEEFEKAKFVRFDTGVPVVSYVESAAKVEEAAIKLLWPKTEEESEIDELLSRIGGATVAENIWQSIANGDAHFERSSDCAKFVKALIGQRLLEKANPPPISMYLFCGGRNLSVIRALFSDKQQFYNEGIENVFHYVATITRSEEVARELQTLLGIGRAKKLLRQSVKGKMPTQLYSPLYEVLSSAYDGKAKAAAH